jgi:hypothetical protein
MEMGLHGFFVKIVCLSLNDLDCVLGALSEAGTQSIAEFVTDQFGFAIDNPKGPLSTVRNTESATRTFSLVNRNNLSRCHGESSFRMNSF